MTIDPFWGAVQEDWAGFSAAYHAQLPGFAQPIPVFLGEEFDDEGEEGGAPTSAQLAAYAGTLQRFLQQAPARVAELQHQTFAYYQRVYAAFYDDASRSQAPPLHLDIARHAAYLQDLTYLRVSAEDTLRLVFRYELDPEHGLEVKFVAHNLVAIGGTADT